jgi:hypothetical protein
LSILGTDEQGYQYLHAALLDNALVTWNASELSTNSTLFIEEESTVTSAPSTNYTQKMQPGKIYSYTVPVDVTIISGAKAYTASYEATSEKQRVVMTEMTGMPIKAGTPFFMVADKNAENTETKVQLQHGMTVNTSVLESTNMGGTYTPYFVAMGQGIVVKNNAFVHSDNYTISPYEAYIKTQLDTNDPNLSKPIEVVYGNQPSDDENPDDETPDDDTSYSLFANDVIGAKAGSQIELAIQVKNPEMDFTSCQFDLVLPEGIEIAKNQKGKYIVTTADRTEDHEILTKPIDGAMQIAMYSMSNEVFYGQEGAVMYLTLNVSKELKNGDYVCNIKNIILNDTNVKEYKPADTKFTINIASYTPGDVNNDGVINVTDISGVVAIWLGTASSNLNFKAADTNNDNQITVTDISGVISIFLNGNSSRMATRTSDASSDTEEYTSMYFAQPLEARQGEEVELAILLNNPGIDFVSAQFDLVLPAGIEISKNKKGKLIIEGTDRTEEHEILHKNVDGATQIALYSMSNEVFWGNEGAILVITLIVDEDMAHGAYDILLKNQILVDPNINENRPADFTGKINVGTDTGIGNIGEGHSGKNVYDMQGRRTKAKQHGVYIINNKKVVK